MATRSTYAHELAARCRRVGWRVTRLATGGYKVHFPPDRALPPYPLHLTPGDVNSERNAAAYLEKTAGLLAAEEKLDAETKRRNAQRLRADRESAEAEAKRLERHAQALNNAAGPYAGPVEMGYEWFAEACDLPQPPLAVLITPEVAGKILADMNTDNRPLSPATRDHYSRILRRPGHWKLTHQGVAVDTRGVLQDGQHRLGAIEATGIAAPMWVFRGMPPENFAVIDDLRVRKFYDVLGQRAEMYGTSLGALVRLLISYRSPFPRTEAIKRRRTNLELLEGLYGDPDGMREAIRWAVAKHRRDKADQLTTPATLAALRYLLRHYNGADNVYVAAFLEGLVTKTKAGSRTMLDEDDPRMAARRHLVNKRIAKQRMVPIDQVGLLIQAWNYLVAGKRRTYMKMDDTMAIPAVNKCAPDTHPVPELLTGEIEHAQAILDAEREDEGVG